jgi:hypothetical protein
LSKVPDTKKHIIEVITIFPSGTRVKFKLPFSEFCNTIKKDNKTRMDEWLKTNDEDNFQTFYKVTKVRYNKINGKLEAVELSSNLRNE